MSCKYLNDKICEIHGLVCDVPPCSCKDYEDADEVTKSDTTKINSVMPTASYCKYCFNARVYKPTEEELMNPFATELTDENDSSSCGVGTSSASTRFMISSGYGEPVRIEIDKFIELRQEWVTVGKYYPKYCPECGRRLDEYDVSET